MRAYDLDGVLSVAPPLSLRPWRLMNGSERNAHRERTLAFYARAPLLHNPPVAEPFLVITARKPEARAASERWLADHFPGRVAKLHMLEKGRTIENVVAFKSAVLRDNRVTDYTEDNRQVVQRLRALKLPCRIWHFKKGQSVLDYDAPLIVG